MSNLYYLVKSGEVKKRAQEYISLTIENTDVIHDKVKAVGGTGYQMGFDGKLRGISFPTVGFALSKEWKNIRNGVSFPKKGTDTFNSLKEISLPKGTDIMKDVLDFPLSIFWENEDERGSSSFGGIDPIEVLWCDDMDDIAIYMPDVNKKIRDLKNTHPDAVLSVNQWSPPKGLVQITEAKWEHMLAESRLKAEERLAIDPSRSLKMIRFTGINPNADKDLTKTLEINPTAIRSIDNPSEDHQVLVVQYDGMYIRHINSPTEKVKTIAVDENFWAIQYIKNPSEYLQELAIRSDCNSFKYIDNPSENIIKEAIEKDILNFRYVKNPSESIQKIAVRKDSYILNSLDNPSDSVKMEAIRSNPFIILGISEPSEDMILEAIKLDSMILRYMKLPEQFLMKVIKTKPETICFVEDSTEAMQLAAVESDPFIISWINNPSRDVVMRACEGNHKALGKVTDYKMFISVANELGIEVDLNEECFVSEPSNG